MFARLSGKYGHRDWIENCEFIQIIRDRKERKGCLRWQGVCGYGGDVKKKKTITATRTD